MIQQAPFEAYRDAIIFGATDEYQIAKQAESIGLPGFDREDASFDGGQGLPGNLGRRNPGLDDESSSRSSYVDVLPLNLGGGSAEDLHAAEVAQAEVRIAIRAVARLALLQDDIEAGGLSGLFARIESKLTLFAERRYLKGALKPGGLVEIVRTPNPLKTVE